MAEKKIKPGPQKVYSQPLVPSRQAPPKPSRANVPLQRVKHVTDQEYRIVLLGRTGAGKSATGNTIFGENVFLSEAAARSQTSACIMHKKTVQGYPLLIVDTPGLFDTSKPNEVVKKEILKLLAITAPGPHAIVLVIPIHIRYTEEMRHSSKYFQQIFGIAAQAYTMVVFTGADNLEADGTSFDEYIASAPSSLNKLLREVNCRYVQFDNRSRSVEKRKDQVENLLRVIREMVAANGGGYYTNEAFEAADKALGEKDAERMQQLETEKERKLRKLRYPSDDERKDLGISGTAEHEANYKKQCAAIADELRQKQANVRQEVRQSILQEEPDLVVTKSWFKKAVDMVASALGFTH